MHEPADALISSSPPAGGGEGERGPVTLTPHQALWIELMPFYIREAWLLDERKLKEWLDLFADDVLYFVRTAS